MPGRQDELAGKAGALLVRIGLGLLMVALPVAAIYSRRFVFSLMPIGAALVLTGALLMPGHRLLHKTRKALLSPPLLAALCLLLWVGLSLAWTPVPGGAAERFAKTLATLLLAFIVLTYLPTQSRTSNLNFLPIGAGATAIAAVVVIFVAPVALQPGQFEATTLERAAVGLVLMVWPALAALALRERWAYAGALAVAVVIAAVAIWTPAALASVIAGALIVFVAQPQPKTLSVVLGAAFALLFLLAPVIPLLFQVAGPVPAVPVAIANSLLTWADIIHADPVRLLAPYGLETVTRGLASGFLPQSMPRSILFEIWFEFGVVGALAAAAVIYTTFVMAGRAPAAVAPFMLAGFACVLTIAIFGLATLQLWWLNIVSVMAIGFGCTIKGRMRNQRPIAPVVVPGFRPYKDASL